MDAALGQGCGGVCGWDGRRTAPRVAVGDFGRSVGAFWDGCMARPYVLVAGVGCGGHQKVFCAGCALGAVSGTGLVHGGRKGGERLGARGGHGGASGDGTGAGGGRLALRPRRDSPHDSPRRGHAHGGGWRAVAFGTTPQARVERWMFASRNRITTGLCPATVLVESPARGGSLISAASAVDQNRELYVFDPPSQGTRWSGNRNLLADGVGWAVRDEGDLWRAMAGDAVRGRGGRPSRPHVGHCGRA